MTKLSEGHHSQDESEQSPPRVRVRLPAFIADEDIGLGDVIKRSTLYVGLTPCGACARRAAALNRWVVFTGRTR
jgi:hypothetical protein